MTNHYTVGDVAVTKIPVIGSDVTVDIGRVRAIEVSGKTCAAISESRHRYIINWIHRDGDRGEVGIDQTIIGDVREAVRAVEIGIGCVAEEAIAVQGQAAAAHVANQHRGQRVAIRVRVVAQHTWGAPLR